MNSEAVYIVVAFLVGIGLGFFHFGGLWLTVQPLPAVRHPALLSLSSFVARTGLSLYGFYVVMNNHWERLIVCLVGLVVMRSVLVRLWMPKATAGIAR